VLDLGMSELVLVGQTAYATGTSQAYARGEAQRALDICVRALRPAAAWTIATASGEPAGGAGATVTELTRWNETTRELEFSFGPKTNLLFLRVADAGAATGTMPPYVVLDFEPRGLGTGRPFEDVNANGVDLAGRMDDDQLKARVLLRTRTVGDRVVLERVLSPAADGASVPEAAVAVADLGPVRLPGGVSPGCVFFRSTASGRIEVRVRVRAFSDAKGKPSVTTAELATEVQLATLAPPR
jgi:hypothetical protein